MENGTKAELVNFVDMITAKGMVNVNTGNGFKAAVSKILGDISGDADARQIDVKTQVVRYNNLHPGELSPVSLKTYEARVLQVLGLFLKWKADPANFKMPQRAGANVSKSSGDKKSKPSPPSLPASHSGNSTMMQAPEGRLSYTSHAPNAAIATATEMNLAMPFPLRPDYLAQVVIPRNLTMEEAERLCNFIKALAQAAPK